MDEPKHLHPTIPTSDRLRADIDSGAAGDKVSVPDPAAAPLGTDAEAAGYPPSRSERAMAARPIGRPRFRSEDGAMTTLVGYGAIVVALGLALLALVAAALGALS